MNREEIVALVEFNSWANGKMLTAAEALTAEQFTQEIISSFHSVRDTFGHILNAEWAWLERLNGRSPAAMPSVKEFADITSLRARWTDMAIRMREYAQGLTQPNLEEIVEYKTFNYGQSRSARWQIIQHVVNHGTYHCGQVTTMLRQLGANPISTDLMQFYREQSAATKA